MDEEGSELENNPGELSMGMEKLVPSFPTAHYGNRVDLDVYFHANNVFPCVLLHLGYGLLTFVFSCIFIGLFSFH